MGRWIGRAADETEGAEPPCPRSRIKPPTAASPPPPLRGPPPHGMGRKRAQSAPRQSKTPAGFPASVSNSTLSGGSGPRSGGDADGAFRWVAQDIAPAPDGFDVVLAVRRRRQLLAQLADEDVDDLQLGLVHAA